MKNLHLKLYFKLIPVQVLNFIALAISSFVGTIFVGNFLGTNDLAAVMVISVFTSAMSVIGLLLSTGLIFKLNKAICNQDQEQQEGVFSVSMIAAVVLGLLVLAICLVIPKQICIAMGGVGDALPNCQSLLIGCSVSYIGMLISAVISTLFQIHSDFKTPIISSIILAVFNIGLYYLFLGVLHLDIFYVGLAITISQTVSTLYLIICYIIKKPIKFKIKQFSFKLLSSVLLIGLTQSIGSVLSAFKDINQNIACSISDGVKSLSAFAVIGSINSVTNALFVAPAFLVVAMMVSGVFINEKDREATIKTARCAIRFGFILSIAMAAIIFFTARLTAILTNYEDTAYATHVVRCFAPAIIPYTIYQVIFMIYGNLERIKTVNILALIGTLITPCLTFYSFAIFSTAENFWIAFPIADLSGLLVVLTYCTIRNKRIPKSIEDILCLDNSFGVSSVNSFTKQLKTLEEVNITYQEIIDFCISKGKDKGTSMKCGLCFEEIGTNIIKHGFTKKRGTINLSVIYENDKIKMIIRDDSKPFNPNERFKHLDSNDPSKGIGIRLIMKIASKVTYKAIYGLNILTISID